MSLTTTTAPKSRTTFKVVASLIVLAILFVLYVATNNSDNTDTSVADGPAPVAQP